MDATVGVILRTKNRPILLKRAIDSVIRQTYQDWVLVIVNDGGSREDIENILHMYPVELINNKVKVIHTTTSLGIGASANLAIKSVKTKFITIHDDDDTWSTEFLNITVATLVSLQAKHNQIQGVISLANIVYEKLEGNIVATERIEPHNRYYTKLVDVRSALKENPFPSIAFLFNYEIGEKLGLLNSELTNAEIIDWDFHKRFLLQYDVAVIPEYLAFRHLRIYGTHMYINESSVNQSDYQLHSEVDYNQEIRVAMKEDKNMHFQLENSIDISYVIKLIKELDKKNDEIMKYVNFIAVKINNNN